MRANGTGLAVGFEFINPKFELMTRKELEAQVTSILMPVAPQDWLVERVCNFVEMYARQQNLQQTPVSGNEPLTVDVKELCDKIVNSDPQTVIKGEIESMAFHIGHHPAVLNARRQ